MPVVLIYISTRSQNLSENILICNSSLTIIVASSVRILKQRLQSFPIILHSELVQNRLKKKYNPHRHPVVVNLITTSK